MNYRQWLLNLNSIKRFISKNSATAAEPLKWSSGNSLVERFIPHWQIPIIITHLIADFRIFGHNLMSP